jgi:hypothetical protein
LQVIHKLCECGCQREVKTPGAHFCAGHQSRGQKRSEETKRRISKSIRDGMTDERRELFRQLALRKDHNAHSFESNAKRVATRKERGSYSHTEATKEKMREAAKGRPSISEETRRKMIESGKRKVITTEHCERISAGKKGKSFSEEHKQKLSEKARERLIEKNPNWKGGYCSKGIPTYDAYVTRLVPMEKVRRDPDNPNILNVRCTHCSNWIQPTLSEVWARIACLERKQEGERRFYCSGMECRSKCSIYKQRYYPKGHRRAVSNEVQAELRELCLMRDGHTCQRCGANDHPLECHHMEPTKMNPIESADLDIVITFCEECHDWAHTLSNCTYLELRRCLPRWYREDFKW